MKLFRIGVLVTLLAALVCVNQAVGQSLTAGGIAGRVTDPTGAVVTNAVVSLKSLDTGETQSITTSSEGLYRFNLLKPARYEVSVSVTGFAKSIRTTTVEVGQVAEVDFALEIAKTAESIEVTGEAPLVSTDPGVSTSYTPTEVSLLPSPGGDITTLAFTAPGVVVATGYGYGNFTVNGLPGTSNLYTVNGENDMDPYFNINNSGATNLTLGANEVQETTITTNPYSGQYGQLMGAQVSYVTKSGTNQFHGNAQWWWNGRYMNANDWLNNSDGSPRPFDNANQWAGAVGGPVVKDKFWFFFDTEGLRFVLPNVDAVTMPTPAFTTAVLANIAEVAPNESATYQFIMNEYANAAKGKAVTGTGFTSQSPGCVPGVVPGWGDPNPKDTGGGPQWDCSQIITTAPTSFAKEEIIAPRLDYKLTSKDDIFFRFKLDYGLQPSYLDPVDSRFDANSNQPAYDYQAQERHVFGSNKTNEFTATLSHYIAQFAQNTAAVNALFPYALNFATNVNFTSFNPSESFPQGRNITQYQFIDNFTWTKGKHNLQFGVNFRRYDVSDHNFFYNSPLVYFRDIGTTGALSNGLADFANGLAFQYRRADNLSSDVPIAFWGMGIYATDTWKVTSNFSLTAALRVERNSDPVCQHNCFANFTGPFDSLASVQAGAGAGDVPYSSDINAGQHTAYPGVDGLVYSPRLAFSWAPGGGNSHLKFFNGKTIISGGAGLFYDNPAAGMVDDLLGNPPVSVMFRIRPPTGTYAFDTTATGSAATYTAAAKAFTISDSYNQIEAALAAINVVFPAPAFTPIEGTIHAPQAQEWNLKIDQQIGQTTAFSINYNGNHVIRLPYNNNWPNAYDGYDIYAGIPGINEAPVVPNYGEVSTIQSGAVSNYNGVTFSLREQYHNWAFMHFNYTYSHSLDEVSNGGLFVINPDSLLGQNNPVSLRTNNYGNSDYDIRHLISADFVISPPVHFGNRLMKGLLGGWQWSGKVFAHTGLPFTVQDGNLEGTIVNGGGNILANQISANATTICGAANAYTNPSPVGCINANAFTNTTAPTWTNYTTWPNETRNQFRGPGYFDIDMGLFKNFQLREKVSLGIGMTAFNALNHPNFSGPDATLNDGTTGQIFSMQGVPASPYGNFLGFDSSPRVVQLTAKFTF
jgi:hypothetical protein